MASNPNIDIKGQGSSAIATINGKTYRWLRGYKRSGSWFWIAVAGKTRLESIDLADHWMVARSGDVYVAWAARPFSYHMLTNSDEPDGWPKFKNPPEDFVAFVGPTEEAAQAQLRLFAEARKTTSLDHLLEKAVWVNAERTTGPRALIVRARYI